MLHGHNYTSHIIKTVGSNFGFGLMIATHRFQACAGPALGVPGLRSEGSRLAQPSGRNLGLDVRKPMKVSWLQSEGLGRPDIHMMGSMGSVIQSFRDPLSLPPATCPTLPASTDLKCCPPVGPDGRIHSYQSRPFHLFPLSSLLSLLFPKKSLNERRIIQCS